MPQMALTAGAADLGADHAVAGIPHKPDVPPIKRVEEARPPGSGVELRSGAEQQQPTQAADVGAGRSRLVEHAAEWSLGAVLQNDLPLLLGQMGGKSLNLIT